MHEFEHHAAQIGLADRAALPAVRGRALDELDAPGAQGLHCSQHVRHAQADALQLLARIGVYRLDGERLGWGRAIARAALICLVLPTIVIGAERRALNDLLLGTAVVSLR